MSLFSAIKRNTKVSRLTDSSYMKRTAHLLAASGFHKLLTMTNCPVSFKFGERVSILIDGVEFDYDIGHTGDVLSMDVFGAWEKNDIAFALNELRNGGVFYDVGANIGWYALNVLLKTPAEVYCFEPQPARLARNLELNKVHPRVFAVALGEKEGVVRMTSEHKAANFVSEKGDIEVPVAMIDRLVETEGLRPPTLIKMDVEGFEYFVLRGAEQVLRRHHPVLMCEVNGLGEKRFGVDDRTMLEFLTEIGYRRVASDCANWVFKPQT